MNAPTQPPDKCPACLSTKFEDKMTRHFPHRVFDCWAYVELDTHEWHGDCSRSFSAAIALRAELAEVKQANHVLSHQLERRADGMDDLTQHLRAERDAALARAEKAEGERDGVMARNQYMADELILIRDILRGAEIEIDDEDSVANGVSVLASCDKEEIKRADLWYGEYMTKSALLESTESERDAALARLAELQAVCDAIA